MEVLGEGSYGCVVRPPVKCETTEKLITEGEHTVSKIFVDKEEFKREVKAAKRLAKIDAESESILVPSRYCRTSLSKVIGSNSIWQCEAIRDIAYETNNTYLYQLMMPYGGMRLDHYVKSHKTNKKVFVHMMQPVFKGLNTMASRKYCHQDIKSSNVLVRPDGRAIIIDYSLMKKFKDIYAKENERRLKHTYYTYPPEYKIYYGLMNNLSDNEIIKGVIKSSQHYSPKYGAVLMSLWGGEDALRSFINKLRLMGNPAAYLTKLADRIDVYAMGAVFIQLEENLSSTKLTAHFKKMYKELIKLMVALDPVDRISPKLLEEKMEILKDI